MTLGARLINDYFLLILPQSFKQLNKRGEHIRQRQVLQAPSYCTPQMKNLKLVICSELRIFCGSHPCAFILLTNGYLKYVDET